MIEISHLVKKYGSHTAVDDVSLTVEPGRIYGFLGPNGAGKSTTMNIVTGYLGATSGEVKINGYDIFKQPEEAKRCIGYLPEIPPLYMDMSVEEYLYFAAELKDVPLKAGRKEKKKLRKQYVEEAMEMVLITDQRNRLIRNLSKGYRQRVGLAQAVLGYPEVIILDEPTVGLDPKQIIEIRRLIKKLGERHTVILSSHILSEISAVCDHILIISKGRLAASGSPEELQKMMQGTAELAVTVIGERGQAEAVLEQMEEIEQYMFENGSEEGSILIHIETKEDTDIRKSLSVALAGAGMPILSMNRSEKSLEDIFLELTENEETPEEEEESGEEETDESNL